MNRETVYHPSLRLSNGIYASCWLLRNTSHGEHLVGLRLCLVISRKSFLRLNAIVTGSHFCRMLGLQWSGAILWTWATLGWCHSHSRMTYLAYNISLPVCSFIEYIAASFTLYSASSRKVFKSQKNRFSVLYERPDGLPLRSRKFSPLGQWLHVWGISGIVVYCNTNLQFIRIQEKSLEYVSCEAFSRARRANVVIVPPLAALLVGELC